MQIERLSPDEYAKTYTPQHVFNSVDFTELNRNKTEDLHYLSIHDTKHRFGIILGERNGMLRHSEASQHVAFRLLNAWRRQSTYCLHTLQNARSNLP